MTQSRKSTGWWNELHDQALLKLTNEWQRLGDIKTLELQLVVFEDLCSAGVAESRREPITHNGSPAGAITYYRIRQ